MAVEVLYSFFMQQVVGIFTCWDGDGVYVVDVIIVEYK